MADLVVLLIGNGGREHALAWKLNQSPRVKSVLVVPGNGGTGAGTLGKVKNINHVKADDFTALMTFAKQNGVDLVVPGPETPLVEGIEGACRAAGIRCFGPTKLAARMEGSKAFAKDFMIRHKIPTAEFRSFTDYESAKSYLLQVSHDVVIKASGLAAGKGVVIPSSKCDALKTIENMMIKKELGTAGDEVVIEEYLQGEELSILSFCDGYTIRSLPPAQDHKQVFDGDMGPMTGGMGCYSPTKVATKQLIDQIHQSILQPTVDGMRREGFPFVGMLFTGFMITKTGPKVLEYNVRFGDPETQTILPLLSPETDLAEVMVACAEHWLDAIELKVEPKFTATVVAAAAGYPGPYVRGDMIRLGSPPSDTMVFHAGTEVNPAGLVTMGGRVIAATATGPTIADAIKQAYAGMATVQFSNMHFRKDIGHRALSSQPKTSDQTEPLTYACAGVSISSGNDLVKDIQGIVKSTARPGADATIGGFGGVVDLVAAGYDSPPLIVGAIDGIGTKSYIAHELGRHGTIGIDCVAMNVNDLLVQGAEPLFFLDCYTCGKLDVKVARDFVQGVADGCIQAGCALVGGETAEMPGLFSAGGLVNDSGDIYDAVGVAVGAVKLGHKLLPDKEGMVAGDVLLGLGSAGCHSNGFSLIRKIVKRAGLSYEDAAPWEGDKITTVGTSLLVPTKIYVKSVLPVVQKGLVKGMAHITGGGLLENVPRMLPKHLAAELDIKTWHEPPVLQWLRKQGKLENEEYARTFNTGLGMVLVVSKADAERVVAEIRAAQEAVSVIGKLIDRKGEGCVLKGLEAWRR